MIRAFPTDKATAGKLVEVITTMLIPRKWVYDQWLYVTLSTYKIFVNLTNHKLQYLQKFFNSQQQPQKKKKYNINRISSLQDSLGD